MHRLSLEMIVAVMIISSGLILVSNGGSTSENIVIDGNAELESSEYVTGSGTISDPYIISDMNMGKYNVSIKNTDKYIVVKKLTFTAAGPEAINIRNVENVTFENITTTDRDIFLYCTNIKNMLVRNCSSSIRMGTDNIILITSSTDILITQCNFNLVQAGFSRVTVEKSQRCRVEKSFFNMIGLKFDPFTGQNRIDGCTFSDATIYLFNSEPGSLIRNCSMSNRNSYSINCCSGLTQISRNHFRSKYGIIFNFCKYISDDSIYGRIDNNTFESCDYGIGYTDFEDNIPSRYEITDNYFGNCSTYAIAFKYGKDNRIWDNVFYHNSGSKDDGSTQQALAGEGKNLWTWNGNGNFWQNHRYPDDNRDGIVDINYTISGTTVDSAPYSNRLLDNKKPMIKVISPSGEYVEDSYVVVKLDNYDKNGIDSFQKSGDGIIWDHIQNRSATSFVLKEGENTLFFRALDGAGVQNTLQKNFILNISNEPLKILNPVEDSYLKDSSVHIAWVIPTKLNPTNLTLILDGVVHELSLKHSSFDVDLAGGVHHLLISVSDDYGLTIDKELIFTVDTQGPILDILSPADGSILSNSQVGFNILAIDNIALGNITVEIDGKTWKDFSLEEEMSLLLEEGDHVLKVMVMDRSGWFKIAYSNFTIGDGDNGLHFVDPEDGMTYTQESIYTVKWVYEGTFRAENTTLWIGTKSYDVEMDNEMEIELTTEGRYDLMLTLSDHHGNIVERRGVLVRDSTAPRLSIRNLKSGDRIRTGELNLSIAALDSSPIVRYQHSLDGFGFITSNHPWFELNLTDGSHTLSLKAIDAAGNSAQIDLEFTVDTIPAKARFKTPSSGEYVDGKNIFLRWTVSSDQDISNITVFVDNLTGFEVTDLSETRIEIGEEGKHNLTLVCFDLAGNMWKDEINILVDLNLPLAQWQEVYPRYSKLGYVHLRFICYDTMGLEAAFVDIDGIQTEVTGSDELNISLEEGHHAIKVTAIDHIGREVSTEDMEVTVDLTDPTVDFLERSVVDRRILLKWEMIDGIGLGSCRLGIDGVWEDCDDQGEYRSDELQYGPHFIMIEATDLAGNLKVAQWSFSINETEGKNKKDEGSFKFFYFAITIPILVVLSGLAAFFILRNKKVEKVEPDPMKVDPLPKISIPALPVKTESISELDKNPDPIYLRPKK